MDENLLKIRLLSNQPNDFMVNEGDSEKNVHLVVQEVRISNHVQQQQKSIILLWIVGFGCLSPSIWFDRQRERIDST